MRTTRISDGVDEKRLGENKIGTLKRGIGPATETKWPRRELLFASRTCWTEVFT